MRQIPFVKENLSPVRVKSIKRSKSSLKEGKSLTLCIEARNYDEHCLSDNVSDSNIRSVICAYIEETGENWHIEYYSGEMTEQQFNEGMANILDLPHKYNNQQINNN